jgi:hypothetical protein
LYEVVPQAVEKQRLKPSAKVTIGWRLGGWNARRLKKGRKGFASSFPAFKLPA